MANTPHLSPNHETGSEKNRSGEERFLTLINATSQIVWICDPEGRVDDIPAWRSFTGQSLEECQGLGWLNAIHPEDRASVYNNFLMARNARTPCESEYRLRRYDGEYRLVLDRGVPILGEDGQPREWVGCCTDIHEQRQNQLSLQSAAAYTRSLIEASIDPFVTIDPVGRITDMNEAFLLATGLSREELIGTDFPEYFTDPDLACDGYQFAFTNGWIRDLPLSIRHILGHTTEVHFNIKVYRDNTGRVLGVFAAARDMADRNQAEQALQQSLLFRREAEKIGRIGAWKVSPKTDYLYWTEGVYEIVEAPLDYKPGLEEGLKLYDSESIPRLREALTKALVDGTPFALQVGLTTFTGRHLWTEVRGLRRLEEGRDAFVMGTFQDITARRQAEISLQESHSLLEATIESTADGILVADGRGRMVRMNRRFAEMWRIPAGISQSGDDQAALGFVLRQLEDPDAFLAKVEQLYLDLEAISFDVIRFKDGRVFERYSQPQRLGNEVVGRVWSFRDITERHRAEKALRFRSDFESLLVNTSARFINVPIQEIDQSLEEVLDQTGRFMDVDRSYIFTYNQAKETASNTHEWCGPGISRQQQNLQDIPTSLAPEWKRLLAENQVIKVRHIDDLPAEAEGARQLMAMQSVLSVLLIPMKMGGELIGMLGFDAVRAPRDWTDDEITLLRMLADVVAHTLVRQRAEEELRQQNLLLTSVIEGTNVGTWRYNVQTEESTFNERWASMVGYTLEELQPTNVETWRNLVHPDDLQEVELRVQNHLHGQSESYQCEVRMRHKNGSWVWVDTRGKVTEWTPDGRPLFMHGTHTDITERRLSQDKLREQQQQLQRLGDNLPQGMVYQLVGTPDGQRRFIYASAGVERLHGVKAADALKDASLLYGQVVEEDRPGLIEKEIECSQNLKPFQAEVRFRRADGEVRWMALHAGPSVLADGTVCWDGVEIDITERKQLEERLRQSQKMEGIGHLAGGVAHEFNNILAAMLMNLDLAKAQTAEAGVQGILSEMESLSGRATELVKQLLAFSRQSVIKRQALDLSVTISQQCRMLGRLLGERVKLQFSTMGGELWVHADKGALEQVLLNLCLNARDAMPTGGVLSLALSRREISPDEAKKHACSQPGRHVCLSVSDTGCGMDAVTLGRLFEPFFTTKEVGQGSGLGLATVRGIVEQHQGWVEVESQPGRGSTFHVFLPAANAPSNEPEKKAPVALNQGRGTILLVEDEPSVRRVTRTLLARQGYRVLEAVDAREAQQLWSRHRQEIDLLYSDMVMPGEITGLQLAEKLLAEKPTLKAVLTSGYTTSVGQLQRQAKESILYLPKPCPPLQLLSVIQECLRPAP